MLLRAKEKDVIMVNKILNKLKRPMETMGLHRIVTNFVRLHKRVQ